MASRPANKLRCDWLTRVVGRLSLALRGRVLAANFRWMSAARAAVARGFRGRRRREPFGKVRFAMADGVDVATALSCRIPGEEEQEDGGVGGEEGSGTEGDGAAGEEGGAGGLSDAQKEVLERCLHALKHAKNDSHTLAALLLITRLCPANQLDQPTLRRIFEAVGLNLPARLLVTAIRGSESSALPPHELLSLGTALLAALSTDPDMASHPQLLTTVPILLGILANGAEQSRARESEMESSTESKDGDKATNGTSARSDLDEAMAADCYQVLTAVCALPSGPDQLLSRGAVPALCRAVEQKQTLSRERGLTLLGRLLSGKTKDRAWSKHRAELLALLIRLSKDACECPDQDRPDACPRLVQFLPPAGVLAESEELKGVMADVAAALRPLVQAKLTPKHLGPVLVLSACLLDSYGWEMMGPPKFCCLLVNRACVEVRMGLEEPPGHQLSPELQHTLTGCYRIMEAAIEQACSAAVTESAAPPPSAVSTLSLEQSRQVFRVLEEAFNAVIYHLQQVEPSRYGDPFVFASFRALCSWLAEETSCLREEVTALLPVLLGYSRSHMRAEEEPERGLSEWMDTLSVSEERAAWTGTEPLRYLLPALCHLSAEESPRKVLLTLDTPALLVDFLSRSWTCVRGGKSGAVSGGRDPGMETCCSALLNFTVTEPERVRKDPCFKTLEGFLSEALPVLVHKPRLLVLAANFCTLGLMMGRLRSAPQASGDSDQRRFLSSALLFLSGALDSGSAPGPVSVSAAWAGGWDEAAELWRLGVQALGGCARAQPWVCGALRDEGWLARTLATLAPCGAPPDPDTQAALEEALCAAAERCPACRRDIAEAASRAKDRGALSSMRKLRKTLKQ